MWYKNIYSSRCSSHSTNEKSERKKCGGDGVCHIACLLSRFESKDSVCCMGDYDALLENEVNLIGNMHDTISERKCIDNMISTAFFI